MRSKHRGNNEKAKDEKRRRELAERYGDDEAEKILRMEHAEAASQYHQPPDQGAQTADVQTDMQHERWRRKRRGPSLVPDSDRHTRETQLPFEEARDEGRKKRRGHRA